MKKFYGKEELLLEEYKKTRISGEKTGG